MIKKSSDIGSRNADLLGGGDEITHFMFGSVNDRLRRRVYHLTERHDLPTFKIGNTLYARKEKLLEWIEANENLRLKK